MRYKFIIKILSYLLLFIAGSLLLPLPFSIYYGGSDVPAFLISSSACLILGLLGIKFFQVDVKIIKAKEGFAVVSLAWLTFAFFGSLPFYIADIGLSFTDSFFESMSGLTTTGATIFKDIEALPAGVLFWRSLTHWFGGLGIIVLTVAILPFLGIGGMQLFKNEVTGPVVDKLSPRIAETAKLLWGVYVFFTAAQTILLMLGGMNLFDALCHSFGTMATGGFSTKNASVAAYSSPYIDYVLIVFMIIAGTNFALLYTLLKGNFRNFLANGEFRIYIIIISLATILIGLHLFFNHTGNVFDSIRFALFQVVSIITTTGFGTADYENWSASSQFILLLLMFIGGCAGSTGGGFKVIRVIILFKFVYNEILRLLHPQAIVFVKFGNLSIERKVLTGIAGYFMIYIIITVLSTLIITFYDVDIITSFAAVAATLNNIGPGLGEVGPTDNYGFFADEVKWLLSFLMMLGRLEIYTVIILLSPVYWRK